MKKPGFSPFAEVWTSNGTSTVPTGNPQWATIVCWGGGHSGAKGVAGSAAGQGGQAGMFSISSVNVVGISQLHLVVGKGGKVPFDTLTVNSGQNTVVRYTNSTGTIVARADRNAGTTTVRTDYANITSYFTSRQSDGGAGASAGSGEGGGGGAPGSDGGVGGAGTSGDVYVSEILANTVQPNDNGFRQGDYHASTVYFPPVHDSSVQFGYGFGGLGGDDNNGTITGTSTELDGLVQTTAATNGGSGAVIIFWGNPSFWNANGWIYNESG